MISLIHSVSIPSHIVKLRTVSSLFWLIASQHAESSMHFSNDNFFSNLHWNKSVARPSTEITAIDKSRYWSLLTNPSERTSEIGWKRGVSFWTSWVVENTGSAISACANRRIWTPRGKMCPSVPSINTLPPRSSLVQRASSRAIWHHLLQTNIDRT